MILWTIFILAGVAKLALRFIKAAEAVAENDSLEKDLSERYDHEGNRVHSK